MYNRQTWYSSEIPLETVLMQQERDASKTLWQFIADALGSTNAIFTGLAATPGTGLEVAIGTGALYQHGEMDPTTWSDMPSDTSSWMLQGLNLSAETLTGFAAPSTVGYSIDYLIEAQIQVTDTATVNMPFTNGAVPPATVFQMKSPSRQNVVAFQVKAGTAATTGTQTAPTADSGWVPLWVVTVAYGETQIITGNIAAAASAPQFYGFVEVNPTGNTPVYLNPSSQQTGALNISGTAQVGEIQATNALFGSATLVTHYDGAWANGFSGDYLNLTAIGWTGSAQTTDSLNIKGSVGYTGSHAGTGLVPAPASAPTLTSSAAGSIAATTYYVTALYTNASGDTTASPEASLAVAANHVLVVDSPPAEAGATGWIPCVSTSTGTETQQVGSPIAIGTNWTEPTSGLISGAAMPGSNTTGDPYPLSQINAALLGGYPASAFALAAGNYVQLYSGAPTLGSGNAGVTGYFEIGVTTGTPPLVVASSTLVVNLNAEFVGGYTPGNANGNVPISNGTLNTNLNAQYLSGLPSSAFQPAGSYAVLNSVNSGNFSATGSITATDNSGNSQIRIGYTTTNAWGINGGGATGFLQSYTTPLGLIGSSVQTNCPLYVGGPSANQNVYAKDLFPSGLVRSGIPCWRVTRNAAYSTTPGILVPGSSGTTDYGVMPALGGGIDKLMGTNPGAPETVGYRMVITLASPLTVTWNVRCADAFAAYLDGTIVGGPYSGGQIDAVFTFTIPSGQHTIDVSHSHFLSSSENPQITLFPWMPYTAGVLSSAILSAING